MCARRVRRAGLGGDTVRGLLTRRRKSGPDLFANPMPSRVERCLAQLSMLREDADGASLCQITQRHDQQPLRSRRMRIRNLRRGEAFPH